MADDVRISTGLRHHRKTKRLRRALGADGCWSLICLFLWAGEERWTGDLSGLSDEDIEEEADWRGTPGALVAALLEVRFLTGATGRRKIHDWETHNPYAAGKGARIAKGKAAVAARWERERKRQEREAAKASNGAGADTPSMPGVEPEHSTATGEDYPPAPTPAPTFPTGESNTHPAASPRPPAEPPSGSFEGHGDQLPAAPNPVAPFAIALTRAGYRCTPMNPDLVAFVQSGGTVEHLLACAAAGECRGKPATYVIRFARRELTEQAGPVAASQGGARRLSVTEQIEQHIRAGQQHDAEPLPALEATDGYFPR